MRYGFFGAVKPIHHAKGAEISPLTPGRSARALPERGAAYARAGRGGARGWRLLALCLMALVVAIIPVAAETVEDELAAFWEKAEPLYAQIEALGARQSEIYSQFNLSLEDESCGVMEDAAYENYVRSLNVLSQEELKELMDANARIVELYDEAVELTDAHAVTEDPLERSVIDRVIHAKYHEIEEITQSVAALDERVRIAEETAYVMGLPGLTEAAQQELISMYGTQRSIEGQLAELEASLSAEAQEALYHEH
jgi:hypothetical protein